MSEWISVKDRLPEKRMDVLCLFQDKQRKGRGDYYRLELSRLDDFCSYGEMRE